MNRVFFQIDDFINVAKRDPKVQFKLNDMLDNYNKLSLNYQSKVGYDTLIQNIILREIINLMTVILADIDIEVKMRLSRIKHSEGKLL